MPDKSAQSVNPQPPEEQIQAADTTDLLYRNKFPAAIPPDAPPAAGQTPRGGSPFSRVILPTALFLFAVAAIAFLVQNLPSWRAKAPQTSSRPKAQAEQLIHFATPQAVWDAEDVSYPLEIEQGQQGFYDFVFFNRSDTDAEFGLERTSCDCSAVKACVLDPDRAKEHKKYQDETRPWRRGLPADDDDAKWQALKAESGDRIVIPARQAGLLRLSWKARRSEGESLNLGVSVWSQPKGVSRDRLYHHLVTRVRVAAPVSFYPNQIDLKEIVPNGKVSREFWCWSPTRATLDVKVRAGEAGPGVRYKAAALEGKGLEELRARLRKEGINTRVKSAAVISMEVAEYRGKDEQMDTGPFHFQPPLTITADGEALTPTTPTVIGSVRGDVRVEGSKERDTVALGDFNSARGTTANVVLVTREGEGLKYLKSEPAWLKAELNEKEKEQVGGGTAWPLRVTVPPGRLEGSLDRRSVLVFQLTRPDGGTRRVRIPVTGTGIRRN